MRCHYELLGITQNASEEEIRKAYRKQCILHHPDKAAQRGENTEKAHVLFQEINAAYECLSDANERAFYDAHRTEILRGTVYTDEEIKSQKKKKNTNKKGKGGFAKSQQRYQDEDDTDNKFDAYGINVMPYFSRDVFDKFDDTPGRRSIEKTSAIFVIVIQWIRIVLHFVVFVLVLLGLDTLAKNVNKFVQEKLLSICPDHDPGCKPGFYAVYDDLFRTLNACEREAAHINGCAYTEAPQFGSSDMDHTFVKKFYAHYENFSSYRSFAEAESEELAKMRNYIHLPERDRRRIEQQLAACRQKSRRQYEDSIRKLASHCKRRDPRIKTIRKLEQMRKEKEFEQRSKAKTEKHNAFMKARAAWQQNNSSAHDQNVEKQDHSPNDNDVFFECTVCQKYFRTEHALECHLNSNVHQRRVAASTHHDDNGQSSSSSSKKKMGTKSTFSSTSRETVPSSEQPPNSSFECSICNKTFTSALALESHSQSRVHRNALKAVRARLRDL